MLYFRLSYDDGVLATERRLLLIDEINRSGRVINSEIAVRLGVSEVTIRADLDELERHGRVTRTHGGAVAVNPTFAVVGFEVRVATNRDSKRRIALAAASYIKSNQTVIFDAGSTVHYLALMMPEITNLTVFTPGISIAQDLLSVEGVETHLLGGRVDRDWLGTVGTPREQGIEELIVQTLFLGAHGVDKDLDIVDLSQDLALNKLQFARRARSIVLMVDSSKWIQPGSSKVMPVERVDVVITDSGVPRDIRQQLEKLDVELIVV